MKLTKMVLSKNNRMLRIGFGFNDNRPFFRVDLWFIAYRLTRK